MSESSSSGSMSLKGMISRFCIMLAAAALVGFGGAFSGAMNSLQSIACAVFISGGSVWQLHFWGWQF